MLTLRNFHFIRKASKASCYKNGRMYSQYGNDELELTHFITRNPRSMEQLRLARKPQGYSLDSPTNNYYYRLNFQASQKYVSGFIEHYKGYIVVSASTKEWCIRKHLYSSIDVSAAQNIGRVLAQRCLQAGISEVHTDLEKIAETSQRVQLFVEALKDGGLALGEVPQIREHAMQFFNPISPTCPWEVSEEYVERMDELFPPESVDQSELTPPR